MKTMRKVSKATSRVAPLMRDAQYKAKLHRRAMRYGKTPGGALRWLDKHYTGNSKDAMRQQMDCAPWEAVMQCELRLFYHDAILAEQNRRKS